MIQNLEDGINKQTKIFRVQNTEYKKEITNLDDHLQNKM